MSSAKHAVPPAVSAASAVSVLAASAVAVPAALAGTAAPAVPAGHVTAVLDAEVVHQMAPAPRPLVTRITSAVQQRSYTIVSGDTLSGIAGRECGKAAAWPGIWGQNKAEARNPDMILPGRKLTFTCAPVTAAMTQAAMAAIPQPSPVHVQVTSVQADPPPAHVAPGAGLCGDGDGDGLGDMPCSELHRGSSVAAGHAAAAVVTGASGTIGTSSGPGGAFGACVVARESGGNSQVMNSSGHYGLYQFSLSTWEAYGGSAADFGHASVAEQERVFSNALAQGGQSNWSPYDGC